MIVRRLSGWPVPGWQSPFGEIERIRKQMNLLADMFSAGSAGEDFAGVFPLINVTEDKGFYYIRTELPGMKPDELDISVTADSFSISGERRIESENAKYHRREREAGKFNRIIGLPGPINPEKVEAKSENGVLTVTLPKSEASKPKKITIK